MDGVRKAKVFTSEQFNSKARSNRMAANAKQGTYLGMTLTGFTAFTAGLYWGGVGIVVTILGAALLLASAAGFYKIKSV
jgi:hypothetical protein